jgi:hypothetical protein
LQQTAAGWASFCEIWTLLLSRDLRNYLLLNYYIEPILRSWIYIQRQCCKILQHTK